MLDYGEQIHDGTPAPVVAGERAVLDIKALHNIWLVGQRATWQLAISPHTYQEIAATHDDEDVKHAKADGDYVEKYAATTAFA